MITATFYSFAKKENSTAQPTGGTSMQISIKDATSVMTPTISVKHTNPSAFNYFRLPSWNRYYWVTNWIYDCGIWYAECVCDVLATYKSAIGSSTQYVKRAYSSCDPNVIDVYPRKAGAVISGSAGTSPFIYDVSSMVYIIGVTSANNPGTIGTATYYALTFAGATGFINHLVSMGYATFTDITDNLAKWLCNPFQWIKSVVIIPVSASSRATYFGDTYVTTMYFGADENGGAFSYQPSGGAYVVSATHAIVVTGSITVPKHPNIDTNHNYLQAEPYSNYSIVFPPFGKLVVQSSALYDLASVSYLIRVDPLTGGGSLFLNTGMYDIGSIAVAESQVGVSMPVDAAVVDLASVGWSTVLAGGANVASYLANGGNLKGIIGAFIDGGISSVSRVQTLSNGGKFCDLGLNPIINLEYYTTVGQDPINYGYPLAQRVQISLLSGFVLCDNAEIEIATATYDEMRQIESYMDNGFFYE